MGRELVLNNNDTAVQVSPSVALESISRAEIDMGIEQAMKYPRDLDRFVTEAKHAACLTVETAASCIYSKPVGKGTVTGPSVRLAEIMASAFGNLRFATRQIGYENGMVTCQAICVDLQKNIQVSEEVTIKVYHDHMLEQTSGAAKAKARRNVILQVIPRAYADAVMEATKEVVAGKGAKNKTSVLDRAKKAIGLFGSLNVSPATVLAKFGYEKVEQIKGEDLVQLLGFWNSVKEDGVAIDSIFPPPAAPVKESKLGKSTPAKAPAKTEAKEAEFTEVADEPTQENPEDIFSE